MTTQEKLKLVTGWIRQDIPRLMELSDGCWVRKKRLLYPEFEENEYFYNHIRGVYQGDKSYILFSYDEDGEVGQSSVDKDYLDKHFEVVGHEPMLNDVLEWVKLNQFLIDDLYVDEDGYFGLIDYGLREFKCLNAHWDLSKRYLKDQSDEVIEFLYNLKNK